MRKHHNTASERVFTTGGLALELGIADDTVRLYEKRGVITARRTTTGVRLFTEADLAAARTFRAAHGRRRVAVSE